MTAAWKKLRFILSVRSDFHIIDSLLIAVHAFVSLVSMSFSVDETLVPRYVNLSENGFELTKKKSRRYPATTITDADYADDIAILANTPDQAETLLHSLERAAASIGLYVNAHKTEYMCYNQTGDISTLEGTPLKLVDKFNHIYIYISNILSVSEDYGCGLFMYGIYDGFHINLWECSMYGYCYIFLFRFM